MTCRGKWNKKQAVADADQQNLKSLKKTSNISILPGIGMTSDPCAWSHASDN